jgi:hypothetical protein
LTWTCSRHKRHLPKWYRKPLVWEDNEDCDMYTGFDKIPKKRKKLEDEEDII